MCLYFFDEFFHEVLSDMRRYFRYQGLWSEKRLTVKELFEEIKDIIDNFDEKPWATQDLTKHVLLLHDLLLTLERNKEAV